VLRGLGVGRLRAAIGTAWGRAFAVLWVTQVVSEVAFSFALPFLPLYIRELGVEDVAEVGLWAGVMSAGFSVSMATMGPVWGWVADRYGRRLMVQRAMFGACVVIGAMGFVQSPAQLMVLRVIQGSLTGVVAATTTMVSLLVPRHHLGSALGLIHAALFMGTSIGPVLGGLFSDGFGFRASFAATAGIFLVSGVLVTLFVAEPERAPEEGARTAKDASGSRGGGLLRRELLGVIGLMALIRFASNAPSPVLALYIEQLDVSGAQLATTVGIVVAATGVASTFTALTLGRVTDRYGRTATLLTCLLAAAAISPLHAWVTSVWQLLALRTLTGLALGGMVPAVQAVLTDLTPPSRRGAAFGWMATASAIGMGAGPVVGSTVAAFWGIPAVFLASTPMFLAGAAALIAVQAVQRRPKEGRPAGA